MRTGDRLLAEAKKRGLSLVSLTLEPASEIPTIYSLAGNRVNVLQRLRLYAKAISRFNRIAISDWNRQFTKDGIDYGCFARNALRNGLEKYLWHECYRLLLLSRSMQIVRPLALLVLYDHGVFEAGSVQMIKRKGIRTIALQHGISNKDIPGYYPVRSDFIACWGGKEKETLISQGIPKEKIVITGFPAFDSKWTDRQSIKTRSPFASERRLKVIIATQAVAASVESYLALTPTARIIKAILEHNRLKSRYQFIFRLHPNETLSPKVQAMAEAGGIQITKGECIAEQFAEADVVATQFSTIGFEALIARLALVSINWQTDNELIPFAQNGVAARSKSPNDFTAAVEMAMNLNKTNQLTVEHFLKAYLCGPKATERIAYLDHDAANSADQE